MANMSQGKQPWVVACYVYVLHGIFGAVTVMLFFSAVHEVKAKLVAAGFRELKETDHWTVKPKDKV